MWLNATILQYYNQPRKSLSMQRYTSTKKYKKKLIQVLVEEKEDDKKPLFVHAFVLFNKGGEENEAEEEMQC